MKRVIDGITYNTATSFKKCVHLKRDDNDRFVTCYVTRKGVTFYHIQKFERSEGHLQDWFDGDYNADTFWDEIYADASDGQIKEKSILVRMPSTLKSDIQELAKDGDSSINAWIVDALKVAVTNAKPKTKAPYDRAAFNAANAKASARTRASLQYLLDERNGSEQ